MDERVTRAAHDDADGQLRLALNVDPSPEFLARVRTRIASEPAPSRWRLAWVMMPVAGLAMLVAAVVLWPRPEPVAPIQIVTAPAPLPAATPAPVIAPSPTPVVETRRVAGTAVARVEPSSHEVVVISDAERRGFEVLLAALERRALPPVPEVQPAMEPAVQLPAPIEIESFTIEPLQVTRLAIEENTP